MGSAEAAVARAARRPALCGAAFARALQPLLRPWFEGEAASAAADWQGWQQRLARIPLADRLFLELPLGQERRRCDIVCSITPGDGTLAAWIDQQSDAAAIVWRQACAVLQAWQRQLAAGQGALWAECLMMWFEFDLLPEVSLLGEPSLFIALRPGAAVAALAEPAAVFPDLRLAIERFAAWRADAPAIFRQDALLLGHIGYMAARAGAGEVLPLRSCWRCDDLAHLWRLLAASGLAVDLDLLAADIAPLAALMALGNSLMLDLDTDRRVHAAFAVEINLFERRPDAAAARIAAVIGVLGRLGLITPAEAAALAPLTGQAEVAPARWIFCLPHHVKLRVSGSRIDSVKLYWLARVTDHPPGGGLAETRRLPRRALRSTPGVIACC